MKKQISLTTPRQKQIPAINNNRLIQKSLEPIPYAEKLENMEKEPLADPEMTSAVAPLKNQRGIVLATSKASLKGVLSMAHGTPQSAHSAWELAQSTDDANVAAAISVFNGSVITAIKAYKTSVKGTDSPSIKLYDDFTQKGAVATAAATSQGAINAVQASVIAAMGVLPTAPGTYRAAVITDEATYEPTIARTEVSYWRTMKSTLDTLS